MKRIRYGIVGFGNFAERLIAPAIRASRNAELVAIQKRSRTEVEERARFLGVPHAFDRVDDLVRHPDVDAVFVASANVAHAAETIAAARAGKHVLVEKPMAMTATECEQMIAASRAAGVKLMVGHMVRFSPAVRLLKERLREGVIGRITFVRSTFTYDARLSQRRWLFDRVAAGGGPLFDIGVHCLDTVRFLVEDEVVDVQAGFSPVPTPTATEATSHIALRFTRGLLGSIYTSYECGVRRSLIEVMGTEGVLTLENFTRSSVTLELCTTPAVNGMPGEAKRESIVVGDLYVEEVERFSDSILKNADEPIPGEEGLKNQRVLDAAMMQARGGRQRP
jgi:1,5-anhydro-D-fructose reductase (1,5-anhydro-D-mannitol-forming)